MAPPTERIIGAAAAAVDLAVRIAALTRTGGQDLAESLRHEERLALLGRLNERYQQMGAYDLFFRDAREISPIEDVRLERLDGLRVMDLHWPSEYETCLPELQEQYDHVTENKTATVRLVTRGAPRPLAVLIHGYLGGVHRMERRIWPLDLFDRIGMDSALFVLPFHGPRAGSARIGGRPPFPGADPRITNEGFRQAMSDLRDLVRWLRRRGHPSVGVMGMSLGGFSTALAATLEPELAFAVPIIPLASIPDTARLNGFLGTTEEEADAQHQALEMVYRMTSPFHRPAAVPPDRLLIVGAERDRITPIVHARRLATHFRCRIETMPGGHLVQFGRGERFRSIARFLREIGVVNGGEP